MTEPQSASTDDTASHEPVLKTRSGPSMVWIIPALTLLIGAWLVYDTMSQQGPRITLEFATAAGIEAGKTRIKYKSVDIGLIETVDFSQDFARVILTAQMEKTAEDLLRRGSRFWVVEPRLTLRGVSGLGTLISGAYITIDPGQGAIQKHFKGLDTPPLVTTDEDGKRVTLMAPSLGSVGIGSPIYYQDIQAGDVLGYELGSDNRSVLIYAFIRAPFDDLLQGNTRFWNVSGVDVTLDSNGLKLHTASLESLMFGGIAFETPASLEPVSKDLSGVVFTLHPSMQAIEETSYTQKVQFLAFFDGSVRGLSIDAPVEFRGIKIGSVRDIRLEYAPMDDRFRIPVLLELEPERVITRGMDPNASPHAVIAQFIKKGLRAQLKTGSLLTGQLFVDFVMRPDTEALTVDAGLDIPQIPTIPADLDQLTNSVKAFLAKLDKVELDQIAAELQGTLAGTNQLANHPKWRQTIDDLGKTIVAMNQLLETLNQRAGPLSAEMSQALTTGKAAFVQGKAALESMNKVLEPGSEMQYNVNRATQELAEAARAIRLFVELLERNPESILFGKQVPR